MHLYKIICIKNQKTQFYLSDFEVEKPSELKVHQGVLDDIKLFGEDNFRLLKLCELNNREKAEEKIKTLKEKEANLYEEREVVEKPVKEEEPVPFEEESFIDIDELEG